MQFWVRQAPGEDKYVIGSDDPGFNEFWKSLGIESVTTKTPLGSFQKFVLDDLVTHTPGAGSMKGPDGHTYPVGTTFQEIQKPTTVRDRIEQQEGFYKWSDHKDDPSLVVMKVKGTGEEQIDKAKLIALTMGLTVPEPKVGGQNVLTFFKKADLDKVLFTDTEYVPTIPAQPPTFIAKALPGFGGSGQDGLPATNNRSDLAVLDMIKPPASGHWIRCGRHGVFWNDQIQVRRVRDTDGKMHWEVMGQVVNGQDLSPAMPSGSLHFQKADGQKFDHYSYDQLSYDSATGIITEKPGNIGTYGGYVGQTANGAVVEIATTTSYPSITGVFRVRIPDGLNVETELADAFTKMGLDAGDAMADPTDQDTNMLIKQQVARAVLGPAGYKKVMIGKVTEADLDEIIKDNKAEALLASATMQHTFNGKQSVMVDDAAEAKKAGFRFCYLGMSNIGSIYARLKEGSGLWSNRTKWMNGVEGNAASADSDNKGGGTLGAFVRAGNVKADGGSWGYKCDGNPKFIVHPRVMQRADWYAFDQSSDSAYGRWMTHSSYGADRHGTYKMTTSASEILFEDGISPRDIAGVAVDDPDHKEKLIQWLKADGITEYNGIPLDKFILVTNSSHSRSFVAENLHGLQEGVLP